jgi:hypothetical protein
VGRTRRAAAVTPARAGGPAPSAAPAPAGPAVKLSVAKAAKDPRFRQTMDKLEKGARQTKQHPPAAKKAAEAQAAALPPDNERPAGAKANQVDAMKEAKTQKPQADTFLTMLRAEIQRLMPKKVEDTEDYMKGDDRQQLKSAMTGNVNQQKAAATGELKTASSQPLDPNTVPGKEVTPLPAEGHPTPPPPIGAAQAMPAPAPQAAVEAPLQQSKQDADKLLADNKITPQQLQKANDPRFSAVLRAKSDVEKNADAAPRAYRSAEQKTLAAAAAKATADERLGRAAFVGVKGRAAAAVRVRQLSAEEKDKAARKKVADDIEGIFNRTKATVERKLGNLESEVTSLFDRGADAAVAKMRDYVETRFDDRYSGVIGKGRWLRDKLLPLPSGVKAWFTEAHDIFLEDLDAVVVRVANLVEARLKEAKDEVKKGQNEVRDYVKSLPTNLQAVGKAAEREVQGRFDELRHGVDEKKNDLAQKLAQRYKEASDKGDAALQELVDKHKSLTEKLVEFVGDIIRILREFKDKLMAAFRKGLDTILMILSDPIGFLGNLLSAIKKGFGQFVDNIWTHLKAGLMAWLFGALAGAGITLPKDFSLPSILHLVLQVLGLTPERIRAKAVKLIGERNVMLLEKAWELISALIKGGPAALWEKIKEYLSNLKEMVMDAIQDWLIPTIVKAAVIKIVSMFNPVGAIVQAVIMIYNTVVFIIERAKQIADLIEAVVNSVSDIASGAIGTAANWIEQALARFIPVVIGFLAALLGISGITDKIRSVIQKIQAKVDQAIDKVIEKIVGGIGKLFGKGKDGKPDERSDEQKVKDLRAAVAKATAIAKDERASRRKKSQALTKIKGEYRLTSLDIVIDQKGAKNRAHVRGSINPTYDGDGYITSEFPPEPKVVIFTELGPPQPRQEFQRKVLEGPTGAGLPGFQRAHLIGAGFGAESPLGIFYTPAEINLKLQNSNIEEFIRQMYAQRFPGARLFVRASAEPHPGTQILARVVYTLFGQMPGEPLVEIFEAKIVIKDASLRPQIKTLAGEVDEEALSRYTSHINTKLASVL